MQSVPSEHVLNSEPGPPSSQSRSPVYWHVLEHELPPSTAGGERRAGGGGFGGEGEGDGRGRRGPQSAQSVPKAQNPRPWEPMPLSWHSPLFASVQVLLHNACARLPAREERRQTRPGLM